MKIKIFAVSLLTIAAFFAHADLLSDANKAAAGKLGTEPRYDKKAAKLAWTRTVKFFKKNLS